MSIIITRSLVLSGLFFLILNSATNSVFVHLLVPKMDKNSQVPNLIDILNYEIFSGQGQKPFGPPFSKSVAGSLPYSSPGTEATEGL